MLPAGVMLLLIMFNDTKYSLPKVSAMAFCILAGVAEFFVLDGNPWAFLIVVLSPLPYFVAMRQERLHSPLFLFTIFMLTIGSAYLFADDIRRPLANLGLAGMVSIFGGLFVWLTVARRRTTGKAPFIGDTLVGMTGEVWVAIEPFSYGSVRIEGELWQARSKDAPSRYTGPRDQAGWDHGNRQKSGKSTRQKELRFPMPFEQHKEKNYSKDAQSIYQAALKATEKLDGKIISSTPEQYRFTARFPKVVLGKTLGDRIELSCAVRSEGDGGDRGHMVYCLSRECPWFATQPVALCINFALALTQEETLR